LKGLSLQRPAPPLGLRQRARPAIEELQHLCTGLDLANEVVDGALHQQIDQPGEERRLAIGPIVTA